MLALQSIKYILNKGNKMNMNVYGSEGTCWAGLKAAPTVFIWKGRLAL